MNNVDLSWQRRFISVFMGIICFPKFIIKREIPSSVQNILIMEWDYLGDIVVAAPAVRAVKKYYPNAKVFLLTNPENREYADSFNFLDGIIYINNPLQLGRRKLNLRSIVETVRELRKRQYDLAVELSGRLTNQFFLFFIKSKYLIGQDPTNDFYLLDKRVNSHRKHQIERNSDVLNLLGVDNSSFNLWDPTTKIHEGFVEEILINKNIKDEFVIIHPLASWQPRQWHMENWRIVARALIEKGMTVIFIGTQKEFEKIEKIVEGLNAKKCFNFAGLFNILQLIAFMKKASFFVGSDSGPMHLAAIAGVKAVILFGPGDPQKWAYKEHTIIYKNPSCGPCAQLAYRSLCAENLMTCKGLVEITPQEVVERCMIFQG